MTKTLHHLPNRHCRTLVPCCLTSKLISRTNVDFKSRTCTLTADLVHCICGMQYPHMHTSPCPLTQVWEKGRRKLLPPEQLLKPVPSSPLSWGHLRATKNSGSDEFFSLVSSCFITFFQPLLSYHMMDEKRYCERGKNKVSHKDESQKKVAAAPERLHLPLLYLLSILSCLRRLSYKTICAVPVSLT